MFGGTIERLGAHGMVHSAGRYQNDLAAPTNTMSLAESLETRSDEMYIPFSSSLLGFPRLLNCFHHDVKSRLVEAVSAGCAIGAG